MFDGDKIKVAQGERSCDLLLNQSNRHGLIAGASGTGKTVTLKVLAEGFSQAGVPVFMADVKGDVTGMAEPGEATESVVKRAADLGAEGWQPKACPVHYWNMLEGQGIPCRITISEMGPDLLGRLLDLTDAQQGVLTIAFRVADDNQMLLIDLKDLRAMLTFLGDHAKEVDTTYGRVSSQSIGAIQRALLTLEDQGGNVFFGEPALNISDWMVTDANGEGLVNILDASKLMQSPRVYAIFLLWMLTELFETLPEVGDLDKPKFVFFFDEAHLLFDDMPKALTDKIVQTVKLIRSKGVGLYFITQSPSDIPDEVLAQLSNRIQHGLRAYTPAEQKAVKAAAQSFRENPAVDVVAALQEVGTGEALVSFLNADGQPEPVERAKVLPPECKMGAATDEVMTGVFQAQADLMGTYGTAVDRESAFEMIQAQSADAAIADNSEGATAEADAAAADKEAVKAAKEAAKEAAREAKEREREEKAQEKAAQKRADQMSKTVNSIIGQIGREAGRQLVRGLFGSLKR